MENKPQVEILMATYNGSKYLREQLDSILNQSYDNFILTISDDCSSDDTVSIVEEYVNRYPNKIRRIVSNKRFGNARDHFFYLMKQCDSDYIMFSDQDDVWLSNKIELSINELLRIEKHHKGIPILVFTDQKVVDEKLNVISDSMTDYERLDVKEISYKKILFQNIVTGCTICMNKALNNLANKVDDYDSIIMHDWWLALVASKFGIVSYINVSTMLYRQHGDNNIGAKNNNEIKYLVNEIKNLDKAKESVVKKKKQANLFSNKYFNDIGVDDKKFLSKLTKKKSGLGFYIANRYLFSTFFRFIGNVIYG